MSKLNIGEYIEGSFNEDKTMTITSESGELSLTLDKGTATALKEHIEHNLEQLKEYER